MCVRDKGAHDRGGEVTPQTRSLECPSLSKSRARHQKFPLEIYFAAQSLNPDLMFYRWAAARPGVSIDMTPSGQSQPRPRLLEHIIGLGLIPEILGLQIASSPSTDAAIPGLYLRSIKVIFSPIRSSTS